MSEFTGRYQRLSVQDAGFLDLEHVGLPQHVAILAVVEGGPLHDPDGRLRLDALRRELGARLELVPRLRQRVLCPRVGQGLPLWVDDPAFDLANHIRAVHLPAPGGQRELLRLCDQLCLQLLNRTRPLWELWLVTGLAQGRVGLVLKLHHTLADGLAAVQIAGLLLDSTAQAPSPTPPPWQPRPAPSGWALVADNLRGRAAGLAAALAWLGHPGKLAAQARALAGAGRLAAGGRRHQRRSLLRRPVGGRRRLAVVRTQLALVKDVAHGHGATVNDLLLAAVTGGLRALLAARGTPTDGLTLYASVPVALRAQADTAALGNQVGLMIVPLPVGEPDPVQRLQHITQATTERKRRPERLASLRPVGSLTILRALNRYSRHQHIVDLFVTNVPGPQRPLYLLGARLLEAFPVVQVAGNVPLSVAALSYDGQLHIGIQSDPDGCPRPGRLRRRPPPVAGGAARGHTAPPRLSRAAQHSIQFQRKRQDGRAAHATSLSSSPAPTCPCEELLSAPVSVHLHHHMGIARLDGLDPQVELHQQQLLRRTTLSPARVRPMP